jgi:hypothetical protein
MTTQPVYVEQREQARRALAARALKKYQRNVKMSAALEAKALGGDGVKFPAALVAVTATLRTTMTRLSEDCITALEHACRQLRVSTRCCKVRSGPTPEESVVAASGLKKLLSCLG